MPRSAPGRRRCSPLGAITATYTLSQQLATAGTFSLTAASPHLVLGSMLTADAASVEITTTTSGDTPATTVRELRIAAAGVTATVGGATGPSATLSNASLGLVVRTVGTGSPQLGVVLTGDVRIADGTTTLLQHSGWRFGYNELTDLDSTPISLETGAGTIVLDLADGETSLSGSGVLPLGTLGSVSADFSIVARTDGLTVTIRNGSVALTLGTATLTLGGLAARVSMTASGVSFDAAAGDYHGATASGTLDLGTVGSLQGTFTFSGSAASGLTLSATGVAARLAAGGAAFTLSDGAITTLTMGTAGVVGQATGTVALTGVPGLEAGGTLNLAVDTTASTPTFQLSGSNGRLVLGGVIGLTGALTVSRTSSTLTVGITGASTGATVTISTTGGVTSFSATGYTALSLPAAVPGVSLAGTAQFGATSGGDLTLSVTGGSLTTPVGTVSGSFTITRHDGLWDITATGLSLFLGQQRSAGDIGLSLTGLTIAVRLLPTGAVVLRGSASTVTLVGVSGVGFTGSLVVAYNPTAGDVTLGTDTVAALTTSVSGTLTLAVGGATLTGAFTVTREGTGDATVLTVDATGVTGSIGTGTTHLTLADGTLHLVRKLGSSSLTTTITASGTVGVTSGGDFAMSGAVQLASDGTTVTLTGTGLALGVGPVQVSGNLAITVSSSQVSITVSGASASINGLAEATGVSGSVVFGTGSPTVDLTVPSLTLHLGPATLSGAVAITTTGITVTGATLTVGSQTMTGTFSITRSSGGAVKLSASGFSIAFGSAATISSGTFDVTISPAGLSGTLSAAVSVNLGSFSITGTTVTVGFDTTGATPSMSLSVTVGSTITLGTLGSITAGTFVLRTAGATTYAAVTGLTATLQGGVNLTAGTGAIVVTSTGVAGYLSGTVSGATASVRWNTTDAAVDTTIDVSGTPMHVVFGSDEGNVFSVALSGSLDFGPVSIEGTISWTHNNTTGRDDFGGTGLTIFFGDGPLTLANGERNPVARGVVITDATVGLVRDGTTYARRRHRLRGPRRLRGRHPGRHRPGPLQQHRRRHRDHPRRDRLGRRGLHRPRRRVTSAPPA